MNKRQRTTLIYLLFCVVFTADSVYRLSIALLYIASVFLYISKSNSNLGLACLGYAFKICSISLLQVLWFWFYHYVLFLVIACPLFLGVSRVFPLAD